MSSAMPGAAFGRTPKSQSRISMISSRRSVVMASSDFRQFSNDSKDGLRVHRVVHPLPPPLGLDEPRLTQYLQVVVHGRLGQAQDWHDITLAQLVHLRDS